MRQAAGLSLLVSFLHCRGGLKTKSSSAHDRAVSDDPHEMVKPLVGMSIFLQGRLAPFKDVGYWVWSAVQIMVGKQNCLESFSIPHCGKCAGRSVSGLLDRPSFL